MGLDIYLRKCADLSTAKAAEEAAESECSALWESAGKYESLSDATKAELRAEIDKVYVKHGCTGTYNRHASITELDDQPSKIDPAHMFKLGYFHSSYNEGGIERVMGNLGLPTLHDIFGAGSDGDDFSPDWDAALVRATAAVDGYAAHLSSPAGRFGITHIRPMFDRGVKNENEALELFMDNLNKNGSRADGFGDHYSNADGHFMLSGMKVHAVITKTYERPARGDVIGALINGPSVFVVYEREKPEDGKDDWYLTALRIVRESIEFVLAQQDKQHYYLVWSG